MHFNHFSAWIIIEGREAPEYAVEVFEDDRIVTCWIPSELGKWTVKTDGNACYGIIIRGDFLPAQTTKEGVSDGASLRPFMFSSLELTDDDTFLGGPSYPRLGLVELAIRPVIVKDPGQGNRSHRSMPKSLPHIKLHERSKKAVTQQISLAAPEPFTGRRSHPTKTLAAGPDLVTFQFHYRPAAVLRANGIMPIIAPRKRKAGFQLQRAPTPWPDDMEEEKMLRERLEAIVDKRLKNETKPGVKAEMTDVKDLTQKEIRKNKKVKIEGLIQGEVIDLT
ncbi:hypothetical protein C8R46DRAFT_1052560 [Mycena filopes]|nr:hypothetical protein C8R46DRAFT_1052560 [Mycena filopes]